MTSPSHSHTISVIEDDYHSHRCACGGTTTATANTDSPHSHLCYTCRSELVEDAHSYPYDHKAHKYGSRRFLS